MDIQNQGSRLAVSLRYFLKKRLAYACGAD